MNRAAPRRRATAKEKREQKKLKVKKMKSKARQIMGGETAVDMVDDMEMFHLDKIKGKGAVRVGVARILALHGRSPASYWIR